MSNKNKTVIGQNGVKKLDKNKKPINVVPKNLTGLSKNKNPNIPIMINVIIICMLISPFLYNKESRRNDSLSNIFTCQYCYAITLSKSNLAE